MGKLTDLKLRGLIRAKVPCAVADGEGLTFTLSKSGTAAWILRYRHGGKPKEITLGRYPDLTLTKARESAAEHRVRVTSGEDVAAIKRAERLEDVQAQTVRALVADYLRASQSALRPSSFRQRERMFNKEVLPFVGGQRADQLPASEIVRLVERTAARSQSTAELVLVCLRGLFAHARAKCLIESDPTTGLKFSAIVGKRELRRERRILKRDDLRSFLVQLAAVGEDNELALRLLLLTGVRKMELQRATWADVDLERKLWTIPRAQTKNGRGYVIPLPDAALDCFHRFKATAGDSALVFPIRVGRSRGKHTSPGRLNYAITLLAGMDGLTPHDLRATLRSNLGELGVRVEVAERCLNHSLGGLLEVYDKSDYMEERRAALNAWADFLSAVERGDTAAKVVPIRHKVA